MLVVIEGCDRTGKTTLAQALVDHHGFEYRHCGSPDFHPLVEYEQMLMDYMPGSGQNIVYDRHCFGERVWPEIFQRETRYTTEMHRHVEMFLISRGAIMVHAEAEPDQIIARLAGSPPGPDKVTRALELFDDVCSDSLLPVTHYDFSRSGFSLQGEVHLLLDWARAAEKVVAPVHRVTSHVVGFGTTLLVGEQPGPAYPGYPISALPFQPFQGSAVYLMQALADLPYVTLTNARTRTEAVRLRPLWLALGEPAVVALGNVASEALDAAEVPHGVVLHPQGLRGFHHEYSELIRRAAKGEDTREETISWT